MTLLLSRADVAALATDDVALTAMQTGFEAEAKGHTLAPVRIDAPSPTGFLRVMPAVLERTMGLKVMTLVEELGTRYLVVLCSVETGEVLALLDADELTRIRTAATTALAARHLVRAPPRSLTVIGTGFEAAGHLAFLAGMWPLEDVFVYSRSQERRRRFAERAAKWGVRGHACGSMETALGKAETVLLATKSKQPVVDGAAIRPNAVVLSIGSTRPDLRELDRTTLARAATLVVDAVDQVLAESGDVIDAVGAGVLTRERIVPLADLCVQAAGLRAASEGRDLTVFKSVGTALQDLALARSVYDHARRDGIGRDVGELAGLKEFTT